jgi:signal peptidase I
MRYDDRPIQPTHHHVDDAEAFADDPPGNATGGADELDSAEPRRRSIVREIAETLLLALIIFVAVRAVVLNFRVDGFSMMPSLHDQEMLLVNRNAYANFDAWSLVDWLPLVEHAEASEIHPFSPPQRGDIIVFDPPVENPEEPYIKRIIGLPGETVEILDDGVFIDGVRLDEPYLGGEETSCDGQRFCGPLTVPEGSVYVFGDNRDDSTDSADFGPVALDRIIGKVWLTYWPPKRFDLAPHVDYSGSDESP